MDCPVHDRDAEAQQEQAAVAKAAPLPVQALEQLSAEDEQRRKDDEDEQKRKAEERRQEFARQQEEHEAELQRREQVRIERQGTFERILANAPETFTAAQLRMVLRAVIHLDPYTFAEELVDAEDENESRTTEEVLLTTIDNTEDGKLTGFALRLALSGHRAIPRKNEPDFLAEADAVFQPTRKTKAKKQTPPTPIRTSAKKNPPKKKLAA